MAVRAQESEELVSRARVLIAEDHAAVADELRRILAPEYEVVATVGDGLALLSAADSLAPDVIVSDITMPGLDGITATQELLRRHPDARVVLVTVHNDPAVVARGRAAGALGYVLKLVADTELVPAVDAALRGEHHPPR
jgi:DNA-binding NarL/FixJ family response regulator